MRISNNSSLDENYTAPVGLLTNGVENPMAVDNTSPLFTWTLHSLDRGEMQTAHKILVASSLCNIILNKGDLWDSGKINSSKSTCVKYNGSPLSAAKRYWWKVRTWNKDNNVSLYSSPATFDLGLEKADWCASYIWDGTANQNNFAYFRKNFNINKAVAFAKVFVSAHNEYKLFLNGNELGKGPARSNPYKYGQYNAFDVSSMLTSGKNVFAAIGHWHGKWMDSGVNASSSFILEVRMEYIDGTFETIITDSTWKTLAYTAFTENDPVYFGDAGGVNNRAVIKYDARIEEENWTTIDFDDSHWSNATVVDRSDYNLYAQLLAQDKEQYELVPISVTQTDGDWFVDFGKCINGYPKLTMRNNTCGSKVKVYYYQLPGVNGEAGWDQYTCKGGTETWKPDFGRHTSFMTLRISGYAETLSKLDVRGVCSHTNAYIEGRFTCSDALLNDIYEMSLRSASQNVQQGIISVDANREQSPWTADAWNVGIGLLYNQKNTMIIDKIVKDYAAEQLDCGDFYACSPAAMFRIPEWSMFWPMLIWQQYLFSGDEELLRNKYSNLRKFINWISKYQDKTTKLIDPPDGSWTEGIRFSDYAGGSLNNGGQNIGTNSQYFENLKIASEIASILGYAEDAFEYAMRGSEVKDGINNYLLNENDRYLTKIGDTQTITLGSCWPLRFDVVPRENKELVKKWIKKSGGNEFGGYGGDTFYTGLFMAGGMGDMIINNLERYKVMIESNNTNWETWENGEYNHAWTSYPAYLFQKYFSGIQPTSGGFSTFNIKPEILGLKFAEAIVPTIKGNIATRWEKASDSSFLITCTIPVNSKAKIYLPKMNLQSVVIKEGVTIIWYNGIYTGELHGINYDGEESSFIRFIVGSGSYSFNVTESPVI